MNLSNFKFLLKNMSKPPKTSMLSTLKLLGFSFLARFIPGKKDEEIYTFNYHPSSDFLDPKIDIPNEKKYTIHVQATSLPIAKKSDNIHEKNIKIKIPSKEEENKKELKNITGKLNIKGEQISMAHTHTSNKKILNFQKDVRRHIKNIICLIECTEEQKNITLLKSEKIINKHISRTEINKITIRSNANPLKHAAAIIYAVLTADETLPKISAEKLSNLVDGNKNTVIRLYHKWYKELTRKTVFDFQNVSLGRNLISLHLFELLINKDVDTHGLIIRLKDIIIINNDKTDLFTSKEKYLISQLEKNIKSLQDLANNYSDIFNEYFLKLITIIKYLIMSIKSHKVIGAGFAISPFINFLLNNDLNLFLAEESFYKAIRSIYKYLKNKHSDLFPDQFRSKNIDPEKRRTIVGSRIKRYMMRNIYDGLYFNIDKKIASCPMCSEFTRNGTFPRIRAKDFHHEDTRLEGYNSTSLYSLFTKYRGNPSFLQVIMERMQNEGVTLKCRCHHIILSSPYFIHFKKLISWENIPSEFPFQDIFDLEAEIIHIIVRISVNNLYQGIKHGKAELDGAMRRIFFSLKKRYIIDHIYGGLCPTCGEFDTKNHLPAFEFNHLYTTLYELGEITLEEYKRYKDIKRRVPELYYLPCSEIVREMDIEQGGYICSNCHRVLHTKIPYIKEIYNDSDLYKKAIRDREEILKKYKQNLIYDKKSVGNPLELEFKRYTEFMDNLFALFEISKKKKDGVTRNDLANYLKMRSQDIFEKRKFSRKYVKIVAGSGQTSPKKYYITYEGKRIVRLIYYFRDYYKERNQQIRMKI